MLGTLHTWNSSSPPLAPLPHLFEERVGRAAAGSDSPHCKLCLPACGSAPPPAPTHAMVQPWLQCLFCCPWWQQNAWSGWRLQYRQPCFSISRPSHLNSSSHRPPTSRLRAPWPLCQSLELVLCLVPRTYTGMQKYAKYEAKSVGRPKKAWGGQKSGAHANRGAKLSLGTWRN